MMVDLFTRIEQAAAYVRDRIRVQPTAGVVLGSGLGAFADKLEDAVSLPYADIPHFPLSGVEGHAGELVAGTVGGVACAVLSGRVHYYEGYSLDEVSFPMRVLAAIGVRSVVVTNAAGGCNPAFEPGDFMLIVDHINLTGHNPLRGPNEERLGPRFPDMSEAYAPALRKVLHGAAREAGVSLHEGVYAGVVGPSYETPAEIRMLQRLGADAVGMSTVAEVIVARHVGLAVVGLSVVTNRAAGLTKETLTHDDVRRVGSRVHEALCNVLAATVARL